MAAVISGSAKRYVIEKTMAMVPFPTPLGISAPLAAINSQDQSGLIAIIAGFALGLALLGVGVKAYTRNYFRHFRYDDIMFCLAMVCWFWQQCREMGS